MVDRPYFMEKEQWYYFDYSKGKYMLTDKAPKKAVDSYKDYMQELSKQVISK